MYPCYQCGGWGPFSSNQKRKGEFKRCESCVSGHVESFFRCGTCGKSFRDQNALTQHEHSHRERTFPCPGCGQMYRGMTDTAMHFESGACQACRGTDNARRAAYQLVAGQQNGSAFLSAPQMLTFNGRMDEQSGYSDTGHNYCCPGCGKTFAMLSSLMQHTSNTQCSNSGQHVNLRLGFNGGGGGGASSSQQMRFFHGTTWHAATTIERDGFLPSTNGCLGRGVYVAREEKARRFAQQRARETGSSYGGLVELLVIVRNPKYVLSNDYHWQGEGYDACRAERTSASTNMEWCIADPNAIQVLRVEAAYV